MANNPVSPDKKDVQDKTLDDVFKALLHDLYNAERQLVEALPVLEEAASNAGLKDTFDVHRQQSKQHIERLDKVFQRVETEKKEAPCKAMQGLIEEAQAVIDSFPKGYIRDSALIIAAQKIKHYEIASYGSICELAYVIGFTKISDLLDHSLEEEEQTDHYLSDLAKDINRLAHGPGREDERE